jgi:hypothetical protein
MKQQQNLTYIGQNIDGGGRRPMLEGKDGELVVTEHAS